MAVKLIADSGLDLNQNLANELGIKLLPILVSFEDGDYYDGVDLTPNEFYDKLVASQTLPKTSQITAYRYEEAMQEVVDGGDEAVVLCLSSELSGTYNNAYLASKKFEGKVYAVDTLSATMGGTNLCLYALQLIKEGKSACEVAQELERVKGKLKIIAMVDTLEYLKKGGRVSAAKAFVGGLLSVKPIIEVIDGRVEVVDKGMGLKKSFAKIVEKIKKLDIDFTKPFGAIYSGNDDINLRKFFEYAPDVWPCGVENVSVRPLGSTIGTHIGPGAIGVIFFEK